MPIALLGVNGVGSEAGNPSITAGRDLPWLQDTVAEDVWTSWAVANYDVVILDGQNQRYAVYNLGQHSLVEPANYQQLRDLLLAAAAAEAQ